MEGLKQFATLFIAVVRNLLLYKAVIENNLLLTVFHHLNIHASYNFRLPCKDLQSRLVFVCCEKKHQGRIKAMSKVGGSTNFPVRYLDTFFHSFTNLPCCLLMWLYNLGLTNKHENTDSQISYSFPRPLLLPHPSPRGRR